MPTARELLEQADALMRRNRGRVSEQDIPELTDEVVVAEAVGADRRDAGRAPASLQVADDVPELTDALGQVEEVSIEAVPDDAEESGWLESMLGESSVTGPAPDSIAVVPPSTVRTAEPAPAADAGTRASSQSDEHELLPESAAAFGSIPDDHANTAVVDPEFDAMLDSPSIEGEFDREFAPPEPPPELIAGVVDEPAAGEAESTVVVEGEALDVALHERAEGARGAAEPAWDAVAEEIRMQVLQRIDIFTDTSLQGELAARLQPVVDRASADLIATINREVGQLLRSYVAEAIEREIAKWRESNP